MDRRLFVAMIGAVSSPLTKERSKREDALIPIA